LEAMNPDVIIMRHAYSGSPHLLKNHTTASIINAGDGTHEHPSQCLLDLLTVRQHKDRIEGLKIAIIGDISHSRVAHSNIQGFTTLGATFMPQGIEQLGAEVCATPAEAVEDADVVMALRIQRERQNDSLIPSLREYAAFFGINRQLLCRAKDDALVMHPGPINRGVEMSPDVADGPQSVILDQVANGVAIRMALLYLIMGGDKNSTGE
ncbi:MAG: aspartate carbamoyltransferase, partial [Desulfopila sp.]